MKKRGQPQKNLKTQSRLHESVYQHFAGLRKGKYSTRQSELGVLLNIANDVFKLNIDIDRFDQLNLSDLSQLISYWKYKGNERSTIRKKLVLLKKHFHLSFIYQTLSSFNCNKPSKKTFNSYPIINLDMIEDEQLRFLSKGQLLFGLNFKEITTLHPGMLCEGVVKVLRRYAFNDRELYISIQSDDQKNWVEQYCKEVYPNNSPKKLIKKQYQLIKKLNVPNLYFRYCYIVSRYYELLSQYHCITKKQQTTVFAQLRKELGYKRNEKSREIIQCLSKTYVMPLTVSIN